MQRHVILTYAVQWRCLERPCSPQRCCISYHRLHQPSSLQDTCAMSPGQQPGPRAPYSYGGHPGDDPRFGPRSDDPRYGPRSDDRWASGRQYTQDGHDRWKTALLAYMLKGLSAVMSWAYAHWTSLVLIHRLHGLAKFVITSPLDHLPA